MIGSSCMSCFWQWEQFWSGNMVLFPTHKATSIMRCKCDSKPATIFCVWLALADSLLTFLVSVIDAEGETTLYGPKGSDNIPSPEKGYGTARHTKMVSPVRPFLRVNDTKGYAKDSMRRQSCVWVYQFFRKNNRRVIFGPSSCSFSIFLLVMPCPYIMRMK